MRDFHTRDPRPTEPVIDVAHLSRSFGANKALADVSLTCLCRLRAWPGDQTTRV